MVNILILGNATDAHCVHLKAALEQASATVYYWDTQRFPMHLRMSWQPDLGSGRLCFPSGEALPLSAIHSVFWRQFTSVRVPNLKEEQYRIAFQDAHSMMRSLIQACPAHWVNSWQAYQFHQEKPLQLWKAQQLGVTIPATLISNDPQQVLEFAQAHRSIIFKPVYGGAHTQHVTAAHLEPERLQRVLRLAPTTIQQYIPGTNVRAYVIANQIYAAEIRSLAVDFRADAQAEIFPLTLPQAVQQQCLAIARAFFLKWTSIDWRLSPNGDYVFLEANPSPMFIHFEKQTGFPITASLVDLLMPQT